MAMTREGRLVRLTLAQGAALDAFLPQLKTALQKGTVSGVTIDMEQVSSIDPATLRALLTAAEQAREAGKDVFVDGVRPQVYKALHLANLTDYFTRLHRG